MYSIQVKASVGIVHACFTGHVAPDEALRAVAQGAALADAGAISRGLCDLSEMDAGLGSLVVLGTALKARFGPDQQLAIVCKSHQLPGLRRLVRLASFEGQLGLFTRERDAVDWLAAEPAGLSITAARHFVSQHDSAPPAAAPAKRRQVA